MSLSLTTKNTLYSPASLYFYLIPFLSFTFKCLFDSVQSCFALDKGCLQKRKLLPSFQALEHKADNNILQQFHL